MGFEGTSLESEARSLIQDHHVGAFLLTSRNITCTYYQLEETPTNDASKPRNKQNRYVHNHISTRTRLKATSSFWTCNRVL